MRFWPGRCRVFEAGFDDLFANLCSRENRATIEAAAGIILQHGSSVVETELMEERELCCTQRFFAALGCISVVYVVGEVVRHSFSFGSDFSC